MTKSLDLRESTASDLPAIVVLYCASFPDEDLSPLLEDLLADRSGVLSLVWDHSGTVVGHVAFSMCGIDERPGHAALLGPLAVLPEWQRKGLGAALVREGLNRMAHAGVTLVLVLGDPAYYGPLGFAREANVAPPYPLAAEWRTAWQSLRLHGGDARSHGQLIVPEPWRRPALWRP